MTKREKRLQRIRQNPKNVAFDDLRRVLEDHGFELRFVSGSHHVFRNEVGERRWKLTIPFKKPHIKVEYVRDALKAIDEIIEIQQEGEGDEEP